MDVWDNKQPGIFWFYSIGGGLSAFTGTVLHLFELLWMLLVGLALALAARPSVERAWVAWMAPLFVVGTYYSRASYGDLGQIEMVVALPLVCLVCLLGRCGTRRPAAACFLVGVLTGVVAVFKVVLLAIPALMLAGTFLIGLRQHRADSRQFLFASLRHAALLLAGFAVVLTLVVAHFAARGALAETYWTTFVYPRAALSEVAGAPVPRLLATGRWLAGSFAPFFPLVVVGTAAVRAKRAHRLVLACLLWMVGAVAVVLIQRFSWWQYHALLLFPPLGLLATVGLDRVVDLLSRTDTWPGWRVVVGLGFVAALSVHPLRMIRARVGPLASSLSQGVVEASAYRRAIDPSGSASLDAASFLRTSSALPGPIYVFGDPRIILASGRPSALPIHGWSWEMMLAEQWEQLPELLERERPAYVYVALGYEELISRRAPEVIRMLETDYHVVESGDPNGVWFGRERRESPRTGPGWAPPVGPEQ